MTETFRELYNQNFSSWPEILADAPPDVVELLDKPISDLTENEANRLDAFPEGLEAKIARLDKALFDLRNH